jgi:hypothetical protein
LFSLFVWGKGSVPRRRLHGPANVSGPSWKRLRRERGLLQRGLRAGDLPTGAGRNLVLCRRGLSLGCVPGLPLPVTASHPGLDAILVRELQRPGKFELGQMVMTPGADLAMGAARQVPPEFLVQHMNGDWGDLPPEDLQENERALRDGSRLFSAYRTRTEENLWVITEWDRSDTTLLLPEEY